MVRATHWPRYALALFIALFSMSQISHAQRIAVAGYHYPPFMYEDEETGIYFDLIQALGKQSGLLFDWKIYPYARVDKFFELGKVHMEVGSSPIWTQSKSEPGIYSLFFYTLEDVVVFRKGESFKVNKPDDLKGKQIGMVRGYSFPQFRALFDANEATRVNGVDELQLLNMLVKRRLDQIVISRDLLRYHQKRSPKYRGLMPGDAIGSYEIGLRIHPSQQEMLVPINKALKHLKDTGIIMTIFERYLALTPPKI